MIARVFTGFIYLFCIISFFRVSFAQNHFQNQEAWSWYLEPTLARKGVCLVSDSVVIVLKEAGPKEIRAYLIGFNDLSNIHNLQAIAYDHSKKRFPFSSLGGSSSDGVWIKSFRIPGDQLSWEKLRFVGIEQITIDNFRKIIIPKTLQTIKDAGLEALPYPEVGKLYAFELTTIDGKKVSSQTLKGKVVLLDFWASWCAPCMKLIPDLKKTYKELRKDGFEVIGINLDDSVDKARKIAQKEKLPWPVVIAPLDKEHRKLWQTASGIQGIPRLLLINRNGILKADVSQFELQTEIRKLVSEKN